MSKSIWQQIDQLKAEHESTRDSVKAHKGWRLKGRKPNGDWYASNGRGLSEVEVRASTSQELLLAIEKGTCEGCGHPVARRTPMGCGERGCKCATCQEVPTGLAAGGASRHG